LRFVEPPVAMFVPAGDYEVEAEFPSGVKKMLVQVRTGRATSVTFEPVQPPLLTIERALDAQLVAAGIERDSALAVSSTRLASYIVAGVGVAALITGIVLGVSANADAAQAANKTNTVSVAQAAAASANGKGVAANVLFGAGGASVVGGVVLFFFSMPEPGMKASGGSL
jgi:hypothetical protein